MSDPSERVDDFEAAWQLGQRPNYLEYLVPAGDPVGDQLNAEIIGIDIERRLKQGDRGPLVAQYPREILGSHFGDMVRHEFQIRWELGDHVPPQEYLELFPNEPSLESLLRLRADCPRCGCESVELLPGKSSATCPACRCELTQRQLFPEMVALFGDRGRIELGPEIGRGTFGIVFRGYDREFDRPVAVKVLRAEYLGNREIEESFWSECKVLAGLEHSGVPSIYARGMLPDQRPFFSMRIVEGETLQALIERGSQTSEGKSSLIEYVRTVCRIVAHAHARNVVHGDISPKNILVSHNGEVFLTDWGPGKRYRPIQRASDPAATSSDSPATLSSSDPGSASRGSSVAATLPFAAPELLGGAEASAASDMFALGSIFNQILTGVPLYEITDWSQPQVDLSTGRQRLEHFADTDSFRIYGELVEVVKQMIDTDPRRRPTARESVNLASRWIDTQSRKATELQTQAAAAAEKAADAEKRAELEQELRKKAESVLAAKTWAILATVGLLLVCVGFAVYGWNSARKHYLAGQELSRLKAEVEQAFEQEKKRTRQVAEIAELLGDVLVTPDPISVDQLGLKRPNEALEQLDPLQVLYRIQSRIENLLPDGGETEAILLSAIGRPLRSNGAFDEALPLLQRSLEIREQAADPDPARLAESHFALASLHHDSRHFETALPHYEQALQFASQAREFGDRLAAIQLRFAWMLGEMKQRERSQEVIDQYIEQQTNLKGKKSMEVELGKIVKLFVSLSVKDKELAQQELLSLADNESGLIKIIASYGMASLHRSMRNYPAAKKTYDSVLQKARGILSPTHPLLGLLLGDMAGMYREIGETERAEELIAEAIEIGRKTMPTHEFMIEALVEYGKLKTGQKEYQQAEDLLLEAYRNARQRSQYVQDHWNQRVVDSLIQLANASGDSVKLQKFQSLPVD